MSPAHVIEPTYEAIKQRLKKGLWSGGTRLEFRRIADELGVSITPVRDSLYRLAGERMVDFEHGDGFRVHRLTETEYRDMLELNLVLLLAALATGPRGSVAGRTDAADYAERVAAIFLALARRSANAELEAGVADLNDRLHHVRNIDPTFLANTAGELARIEDALDGDASGVSVRMLVMRYHERRANEAASLVRRLGTEDQGS